MSQHYTKDQALGALRKAHAAGDNDAVEEWAAYLDSIAEAPVEDAGYIPQQTPLADIGSQLKQSVMGGFEEAGDNFNQNVSDFSSVMTEKAQAGVSPFSRPTGGTDARPQDLGQMAAYTASDVGGPIVGETAGALFKAGGQLLSNITPDAIEKPTVDTFQQLGENIANSSWVKQGLQLAAENWPAYLTWADEHPAWDKQLKTGFNLAAIAAPATKALPVTPLLSRASGAMRRSGRVANIKAKHEAVWSMLTPLHPETRPDAPMGMPTETEGLFKKIVPVKSPIEEEVISVVSLIPNLKPYGNFTDSRNTIYKEINSTAKRLTSRIDKAGNPAINKSAVAKALEDEATRLKGSVGFSLAGATPKFADNLMDTAVKLIRESDGTANGLLQARKNLDTFIFKNTPAQLTEEYVNSKAVAVSAIRKLMNENVQAVVPDIDVDGLLRKQHLMYKAWDTTMEKSVDEARGAAGRIWQNTVRTTGLNIPTTPLALTTTATAGMGFLTSGLAAYTAVSLAAAGAGVVGYRILSSGNTRQVIGTLIEGASKAIKATKSKEMLEQLKADRIILITILNDMEKKSREEKELKKPKRTSAR